MALHFTRLSSQNLSLNILFIFYLLHLMFHIKMLNTSLALLQNRFYSKQSSWGQVPLPAILNWVRAGWLRKYIFFSRLVFLTYRAFVPHSLIPNQFTPLILLLLMEKKHLIEIFANINTENTASPTIFFSLFLNTLESSEGVAQTGLYSILAWASLILVCKEHAQFQNFH